MTLIDNLDRFWESCGQPPCCACTTCPCGDPAQDSGSLCVNCAAGNHLRRGPDSTAQEDGR